MSGDIHDLDLENVNTSNDDRIGGRHHIELPRTGGTGAIKSIFNPANKGRLFFAGLVGLLVIGVGIILYSRVTPSDGQLIGSSDVANGNVRTGRTAVPSNLQKEEAARYNGDPLNQEQRENPSAHPVVVTTEAEEPVFAEQRTFEKPDRISQSGNASNHADSTNSVPTHAAKPAVVSKDQIELIKQLIDEEKKEPQLDQVSWTYARVKSPTTQAGSRSQAVSQNSDDDASGQISGELPMKCRNPIIRAGRQYVSRATIAVNSDVGGPIIVELLNGPLRKHRLTGTFEKKEEWLRMSFNDVVGVADPKPIKAIGLDMKTVLNAVSGDVDSHTLYRFGWWGVGAALSAVGRAAQANGDTTINYVGDSVVASTASSSAREIKIAAGDLGQSLGEVFKGRIARPDTVSVNVNDQIGIVFMDDVCGDTK